MRLQTSSSRWRRLGWLLTVSLWTACCGPASAQTPTPKLGLLFAEPERLRTVPLASTPFSGSELPARADLSDKLPPPGNQGQQSSCVGWASAFALKSLQEKEEMKWTLTDERGAVLPGRVFSPAFVYNQINRGRDGGSFIMDALNLLANQGCATLADCPYDVASYTTTPSEAATRNARRYRIDYWRQVNVQDAKELKAQINAGFPVIIGAMVDDEFMNLRGGIWQAPGPGKGGHAMLTVGYDDARSAFKVVNSWGREWGENGYGWISYAAFARAVREAFVAKDAINGDRPEPPRPNPDTPVTPPVAESFNLTLTNVAHNVFEPRLGNCMVFQGTARLPAGRARWGQIVVHVFYNNGANGRGLPVPAVAPGFRDLHGYVATGTPGFGVGDSGIDGGWSVYLPYGAVSYGFGWMTLPTGQPYYRNGVGYYVAEVDLFADGFGVAKGASTPFQAAF